MPRFICESCGAVESVETFDELPARRCPGGHEHNPFHGWILAEAVGGGDHGAAIVTDGGTTMSKTDTTDTNSESTDTDTDTETAVEDATLPKAFLAEASGPVTRLTTRADGVVERETVDVEISQRLETLREFATFYEIRSSSQWKRAALNELLANVESADVRYDIDADQLEAWSVTVDGRASAYEQLVDRLGSLDVSDPDADLQAAVGRELSNSAESLQFGRQDVLEITQTLAQNCKLSPLFGPGAALAEIAATHADRDDITAHVEQLLEELEAER